MFNSAVGQPTSNSYVSVEYAEAYFVSTINSIGWPSDVADKQTALQEATRVLDEQFQWRGVIASDDQALGWPRKDFKDPNGRAVADNIIPKRVGDATCSLALFLLQNGGLSQTSVDVKGLKVGPIDLKFESNEGVSGAPQYLVKALLGYGNFIGHVNGAAYSVSAIRC